MYFNPSEFKISGTYVWYYFVCKREVWLLSRGITADQENTNMEIGRFIHEDSYTRDKKEIEFAGMKVDVVKKEDGRLVIGEIKKTSKHMESARMQLLLYLSELEEAGVKAEGMLLVPEEKTREEVVLDDGARDKLEEVKRDIMGIVSKENPPAPEKVKFCGACAYGEMCWA